MAELVREKGSHLQKMTENNTFCLSLTLTLMWVHMRSLPTRAPGFYCSTRDPQDCLCSGLPGP